MDIEVTATIEVEYDKETYNSSPVIVIGDKNIHGKSLVRKMRLLKAGDLILNYPQLRLIKYCNDFVPAIFHAGICH